MSELVIKNLTPGKVINFYLRGQAFGESGVSPTISMPMPKACPLLNTTSLKVSAVRAADESVTTGAIKFYFVGYNTVPLSSSQYILRIRLRDDKAREELVSGEKVVITSPAGAFANVNGDRFTIQKSYRSSSGKTWLIDLLVSTAKPIIGPVPGTVTSGTSYLEEVQKYRKQNRYTLTHNLQDFLINEKLPETLSNPTSAVIDVPIFAYKSSTTGIFRSSDPKYLLYNRINGVNPTVRVDEENPPAFNQNTVTSFWGNPLYPTPSYNFNLYIGKDTTFQFFMSVARYIKRKDSGWTGKWLQTNKSNKAIWVRDSRA